MGFYCTPMRVGMEIISLSWDLAYHRGIVLFNKQTELQGELELESRNQF